MRQRISILAALALIASLLGCGAVVGAGVSGGTENPGVLGAVADPNHLGMNGDAGIEGGTADQGTQAGNECSGSVCAVDTPLGYTEDLK